MRKAVSIAVLTLLLASTMTAATFDRVTDRDLYDRADLIVVATVIDSTARAEGRDVFTDSRLRVEEVVKGQLAGDEVVITQLGGYANGRGIAISGSAVYTKGERVLTFLRQQPDGSYVTAYMGLGRFRFTEAENSRVLLVRDDDGIEVRDESGSASRPAVEFLNALRAGHPEQMPRVRVQSDSVPDQPTSNASAASYVKTSVAAAGGHPLRWKNCETNCTVNFTVNNTHPSVNTTVGLDNALDAWTNDPNSNIKLQTNNIGSDTNWTNDDVNDIVFGWNGSAPHAECEGAIGCGIVYYNGPPDTHTFDGSTFNNIVSADVIIRDLVNTQGFFELVLAHELGHAIGFRHSNQGTPSSTNAIMNSNVTGSGATLKAWDKEALAEVYGAGSPCQNVTITSTNGGGFVQSGNTKTLSVSATGDTPFTYQWYEGVSGDTTTSVGTNSNQFTTPPITVEKKYWVKVSNSCPSSANSQTITVTPQACDQPSITTQPQSVQITSGNTATLTIAANGDTPLTYKWYQGAVGNTSNQVGTGTSFTTPALTQTTTYWVLVSNSCGTKNSNLATVTVSAACVQPTVTTQPASSGVAVGESGSLSVVAGGTSPFTYQWYLGEAPNTTQPISGATSATYAPGPFNAVGVFKYWVKITNGCGSVDSATATITVGGGCIPATINGQPVNVSVLPNQDVTLNITPSGTAPFTYQWYQGDSGNEAQPIGGQTTSSYLAGPFPTPGTHKFWAKVSNGCGTVNSVTIIVTVGCGSASTPKISAPAAAHYSLSYDVSWTGDLLQTPTFELQESTTSNFTSNVQTFIVNGAKKFSVPAHLLITADTRFYYRVRGINGCNSLPTPYSEVTSTAVSRPQPTTNTSFSVSVPESSKQTFVQDLLVPGFGDTATNGDTFAITIDVPWMTVFPASGALSAGGTTVQLTINPATLSVGSTTATIRIERFQPSSGKVRTNGSSVATLPFGVSLVTPVTPQPRGTSAPPGTMLIPAVAHADGIGTRFQSDVRIVNTSNESIEYEIAFTSSGQNGTQTGKLTTITIGANEVKSFDDIVKAWYGAGVLGELGLGTIEIRPLNGANPLATFASSRTYAVDDTRGGTYGQFIPAIHLDKFIGNLSDDSLAKISLQQVANSAAYRTNFGLVEGSGASATALIKLFDSNNNLLQTVERGLQPFGHEQVSFAGLFGGTPVNDGRIEVTVNSAAGKVSAYASVIDNATSDPLLIFPEQALRTTAKHYVVPGIAELNNGPASNFHSDMRIFNAGTQPQTITLNYFPFGATSPPVASVQRVVDPGKVTAIDNVIPTLWNLNGTGGAVTIDSASDASLVVTARTFSRDDKGGTYGQFIPGVTAANAVGRGERSLEVLQLEQSEQYRTNLGVVEVTGKPVRVEITAYKPDSKTTAVVAYDLGPNEFRQYGQIFSSFGMPTVYGGRIAVKVLEGEGRVAAYGSVVDNRTVDPTYVPAQ